MDSNNSVTDIINYRKGLLNDEKPLSQLKAESQDLLRELDRLNNEILQNNEVSKNYFNVKNSIDKRNRKQLSDYTKQMRILNEGAFSMEKGNQESEGDYLDTL